MSGRALNSLDRALRLFHTVRHLKARQISNRIARKLKPAKARLGATPSLREAGGSAPVWLPRQQSILSDDRFRFMNLERKLAFPAGWNDTEAEKLWLYNLHYFDGLLSPDTDNALKGQLIGQWIADNSPGDGHGHGNGWEPYPISLRIVNWIKWCLSGGVLSDDALNSLAVQVRFLEDSLEYHLLGNHLFTNAKALIFAGLFFGGPEGDRWCDKGLEIFASELAEQFLPDGGHFELSPAYHAIMTEDLMDVMAMMRLYQHHIPSALADSTSRALGWLSIMARPDGGAAHFNDSPGAPSLVDLMAMAARLGIDVPAPIETGITDLATSGYIRAQYDDYSLIADLGPIGPDYIPGHGHCDMLSFELFAGDAPVIVNTGVSTYERGERRDLERGTASHNTVQIGAAEQSDIWAGFRVGRRAQVLAREVGANYVEAAIRDIQGNMHARRFAFTSGQVTITDTIGPEPELATAALHFAPGLEPVQEGDKWIVGGLAITFEGATSVRLESYQYAAGFNDLKSAKVLRADFTAKLYTRLSSAGTMTEATGSSL